MFSFSYVGYAYIVFAQSGLYASRAVECVALKTEAAMCVGSARAFSLFVIYISVHNWLGRQGERYSSKRTKT